ncbi:MAG: hypothetical protein ACI9FN_002206 [Saprospiraceae bacterium]|jgi:hypothetical protein
MLKKVKDWLGIEGVNVDLEVTEEFRLKDELVEGLIRISSQSDQFVEKATISLKEKYKRGRRKSKLIDEYQLGQQEILINKAIARDEIIEQVFQLNFSPIKSAMDRWGDKNFIFRGISGIAKLAKNAHSTYEVIVEIAVKGNKLKPYKKMEVVAT